MKMITKICSVIFRTDSLPAIGGAAGALSQSNNLMWPTWEQIVYTVVLAAVGAAVGYLVKLILDELVDICKQKNKH